MRQFGAVQIVNNVGQRRESDWEAIKAAIAAGEVVICLSAYETDVLEQFLTGKFPCGGNVRFDCKKVPRWHLVVEDGFAELQPIEWQCMHCGKDFVDKFHLAGHARRDHRQIIEREEALQAAE